MFPVALYKLIDFFLFSFCLWWFQTYLFQTKLSTKKLNSNFSEKIFCNFSQGIIQKKSASGSRMLSCLVIFFKKNLFWSKNAKNGL